MWSILPEPYVMWVVVDWMARLSEGVLTPSSLSATDEGVAFIVDTAAKASAQLTANGGNWPGPDELPGAVREAVARGRLTGGPWIQCHDATAPSRDEVLRRADGATGRGPLRRLRGGPRPRRAERLRQVNAHQAALRLPSARPGRRGRTRRPAVPARQHPRGACGRTSLRPSGSRPGPAAEHPRQHDARPPVPGRSGRPDQVARGGRPGERLPAPGRRGRRRPVPGRIAQHDASAPRSRSRGPCPTPGTGGC